MSERPDQAHSPVLYVVPLGEGQPDNAAQSVISAFAACGFEVVTHVGRVNTGGR